MKLGICCSIGDAREALAAGFEYIELSASEMAASEDLSAYQGLPVEATNLFFPGNMRLYDDGRAEALTLGRKTMEVAASLGVQIMVIGSGGARRAPDGLEPRAAVIQFVDLVAELASHARELGVQLAPESLNHKETNVGNSLPELALALAERGIGYTADSYHILVDAEAKAQPVDWGTELQTGLPLHVHLADLARNVPAGSDPAIHAFFQQLSQQGYTGRVSFEGNRRSLGWAECVTALRPWVA